jgi:excisionase family DNA binding protein
MTDTQFELLLSEISELKNLIQQQRPDFLSVQDFARQAGLSQSAIRKMIADKRLRAIKTGSKQQSKVLIPFSELKRMERRK